MNRTEAGVERVSQAEGVQMPMWGDQGLRRVFPSLEFTTASCGAEHQRRQMRHMTSALWKVQCVAIWSSLSGKRGQ